MGGGFSVLLEGMSRKLRFVPEGGALVEVTCRTIHGRLLMLPSQQLDEIVVGILARAQRTFQVRCCGYCFLGNHYHLLLDVDSAQQLSKFMGYVNSNLAKELGRLADWRDKFWSRRYQAILVSAEESAQRERLKYVLSHGPKEGLVERPGEWPGVHAARDFAEGRPVEGYWFDRTRENAAGRRRKTFDRLRFATRETLILSPLPCWKDLSEAAWRQRAAALVTEIEDEFVAQRVRTGSQPLGVSAILGQHPHDRPQRSKKSPAPFVHAVSRQIRRELYEAYRGFVAAYRTAAEKLRAGDPTARFPAGSFPPALPFVAA
jgi:REP element-mobilizing transposase RayT